MAFISPCCRCSQSFSAPVGYQTKLDGFFRSRSIALLLMWPAYGFPLTWLMTAFLVPWLICPAVHFETGL